MLTRNPFFPLHLSQLKFFTIPERSDYSERLSFNPFLYPCYVYQDVTSRNHTRANRTLFALSYP